MDGTKILKEVWGENVLVPLYDTEETVCGIIYNKQAFYFQKNLQGDIIGITNASGTAVAITDASGNITDTFQYDTYGKLLSRTGTSFVIFGYNGRDGVITDKNGLVYMRARYYAPELRRFVNADIIPGQISNAVTLNRYAYANGNPVTNVDPFGLSAEGGTQVFYNRIKTKYKKYWDIIDKGHYQSLLKAAHVEEQSFATWFDNNVAQPVGKAFSDAGTQIQEGFEAALNFLKDAGEQMGAFVENTFGAGVVQSQTYDAMSIKTLIFGYEEGYSTSSVICGDISKPISFYAKNASDWWKI